MSQQNGDALGALVNYDAEQCVLGAIMADNAHMIEVEGVVDQADFYFELHGALFGILRDLHERGVPMDVVTVAVEAAGSGLAGFEGAPMLVAMVEATPHADNAHAYAAIVARLATQRALAAAGQSIYREIMAGDTQADPATLQARAYDILTEGVREARDVDAFNLGDMADEWAIDTATPLEERGAFVETGLWELDDKFDGGLHKRDLIVVASRPGLGKTSLALTVFLNMVLRGDRVLMFSLEMSRQQVLSRLLSLYTGVSLAKVRHTDEGSTHYQELVDGLTVLRTLDGLVYDRSRATVADIRAVSQRQHRKDPLSVVMVDYLQRVQVGGGGGKDSSRHLEVAGIAEGLKNIAKDLEVPVLALAQLNRGVEQRTDKHPMQSDLKEAGKIEEEADVIVMLYREGYYNADPQYRTHAEANVIKHRNGGTGTVQLKWTPELTKFESMSQRPERRVAIAPF